MDKSYIKLNNIYYTAHKKCILKGLNLVLNKSQFTVLTGTNGCGKTTLSKLITGIIFPDKGEILIDGLNIKNYKLHEIGNKIGYVFQNPSHQIFTPTIEEELSFAMKYKEFDNNIIKAKVNEMITKFSLDNSRNVTTYNLSQGEKQRLSIACMLINEPEYMILDEPTVGLDTVRKEELFEELKHLNKSGIGILLITHDFDFADKYADRIISLKDGKIYDVS